MGRESRAVRSNDSLMNQSRGVSSLDARMAEWQTRAAQNRLSVRTCGFKSHSGHGVRAGQRWDLYDALSARWHGSDTARSRSFRGERPSARDRGVSADRTALGAFDGHDQTRSVHSVEAPSGSTAQLFWECGVAGTASAPSSMFGFFSGVSGPPFRFPTRRSERSAHDSAPSPEEVWRCGAEDAANSCRGGDEPDCGRSDLDSRETEHKAIASWISGSRREPRRGGVGWGRPWPQLRVWSSGRRGVPVLLVESPRGSGHVVLRPVGDIGCAVRGRRRMGRVPRCGWKVSPTAWRAVRRERRARRARGRALEVS